MGWTHPGEAEPSSSGPGRRREIVGLRKTGSGFYAPAASAIAGRELLKDKKPRAALRRTAQRAIRGRWLYVGVPW
jgi:hypothetical protein